MIISCGKSTHQIKNEYKKELEVSNQTAINELNSKYNAVVGWDTLSIPEYTFQLQEKFINTGKAISFEGQIVDIIKSDSDYILKIYDKNSNGDNNYIANISVTADQFSKLILLLHKNRILNNGCFIFKVSKIYMVYPQIKPETESDEEDAYSYLDYDFDETLTILRGSLIYYYINKTTQR